MNLPKNVVFVGDKVRHVLVEEDGQIFSVSVKGKKQEKNGDAGTNNKSNVVASSKTKESDKAHKKHQDRGELIPSRVHEANNKQKASETKLKYQATKENREDLVLDRPMKVPSFV